MEGHLGSGKASSHHKTAKTQNNQLSPEAKPRSKFGSVLKVEKHERSYDDFHPQILKNVNCHLLKSKGVQQKQPVERKLHKSEELVMYMSNLPSYLERGENPQEKTFNIGVLDWRLLKKWQHNQKDISLVNGNSSLFSSNTSSFISFEGSSSHSSRDHSCSPALQRMHHPSSPSQSKAPPTERCFNGTKNFAGNGEKFQDCRSSPINALKVLQSTFPENQSSILDSVSSLKECKNTDLQRDPETRSKLFENDSVSSGFEWKDMTHRSDALKSQKKLPFQSSSVIDRDCGKSYKTTMPVPRDGTGNQHTALNYPSDSSEGGNIKSTQSNIYIGGSSATVFQSEFTKDSQSEIKQNVPIPGSISVSPSRRKNLDGKNCDPVQRNLSDKFSQMKAGISEPTKVKNPSPTRRLSFGMVRIGKSCSSNVNSAMPNSIVTSFSACSSNSNCEVSNANSRDRSSPLRRIFDPLLKPMGRNSRHFARSRDPSTTDETFKSSGGLRESPGSCPMGVTDIRKSGSSTLQALLQVAVKNGVPLFTFTVDNCSDILAATVKESSSPKKKVSRWIYTFFSFSETRKKNGYWIYQGSKDRNHEYIPNVIAQMKVSDVAYTDSCRQKPMIRSNAREFVLFSVGPRDVDQTSDSLPSDELAAIVIKFHDKISGQIPQDGQKTGTINEPSTVGLKEPFQEVRNYACCGDDEGNKSAGDDLFNATVILPGDDHGVPSKGEPSPLIKRWKSGASCDCGGWDLGCRITILTNNIPLCARSNLTKSRLTAGRFKLFLEEEVTKKRPFFILSPYKDGIFSVQFNSSIKLIQAFSIGIAVLNGRSPAGLSPIVFGDKTSEEIITSSANSVAKISKQALSEVSAK